MTTVTKKVSFISKTLPRCEGGNWEVILDNRFRADREAFEEIRKHSELDRRERLYIIQPKDLFPRLIEMGYTLIIDGVVCKYASKIVERVLKLAWEPIFEEYHSIPAKRQQIEEEIKAQEAALKLLYKPGNDLFTLLRTAPQVENEEPTREIDGLLRLNENVLEAWEWYEPSYEDFSQRRTHCVRMTPHVRNLVESYLESQPAIRQAKGNLNHLSKTQRAYWSSAVAPLDKYRTKKIA